MAVSSSFVLVVSLIASGLMMCASLQLSDERIRAMCESQKVNPEIGLGISLGMTNSSAVVFTDPFCTGDLDLTKVPMNDLGFTNMPSCVAFTDSGDVLIGDLAKDQQFLNPRRTICGLNRLIGKNYSDVDVQAYIKTLPYKVVNKEDRPHIEVEFGNRGIEMKLVFSVEEICGMLFGKIKELAEKYTGRQIRRMVVAFDDQYSDESTTSSSKGGCFNDNNVKRSVIEAGKMVGLQIVDIWDCTSVGAKLVSRFWPRCGGGFSVLPSFDRIRACGFVSFDPAMAEFYSLTKEEYIC